MPHKKTEQTSSKARRKDTRRAFLFVDDRLRSDFYVTFGKRVRALRLQQGLTQEVLAKSAGIDRTYLAQIEAGKRRMALHVAWNLAVSLHLSLDELLES